MGDAAGGGGVDAGDPDETIDAATRAEPVAEPRVPAGTPADDYAELPAIERHHYVVEGEIAKGGMGRVLAARDRRLGREVAIKELLPKNRDAARRFEREARITARLQHPAIIHIYEAGTWPGGEPFYAMPRVAGRSLDAVVGERATLNDRLGLLPNVIAVADALAYAHSERVIHRDLKPSNVLVGEFGETVVIDWGLAKDLGAASEAGESMQLRAQGSEDTVSGSVVGTPAYMPPEQARGETVDARADVYALGALLYKVLVGRAPYTGTSSQAVLDEVRLGPPRPVGECEAGAPHDLVAIVEKAMAREPSARYATAGEVAADLKRFQTGQLVAAHRYTAGQLVWRWLRRRLLVVSIGAAALVAIAVVAIISVKRIVAEKAVAEAGRHALLEERARNELLAGHPGKALVYLVEAARDGVIGGVRGFMLAEAMQPFERQLAKLPGGPIAAVSPDGKHVATAGTSVQVWSTERLPAEGQRAQPEATFELVEHGRIKVLAWSGDGKRLVAASDNGAVWVWTNEGTPLAVLQHGTAAIRDAVLDAHGARVATASADHTAIVWDVAQGTQLAKSTCHSAPVVSVRFSPSGDRVVTASEDNTACVWAAATGTTMALLRGHSAPVEMATWANGERWIVTAGDDGIARVWNAELGKPVIAPLVHAAGNVVVRLAIVSHDGRYVLTAGTDGFARIWELPASVPNDGSVAIARPVGTLEGHVGAIVDAAFSDDDLLVATSGLDRLARVWDRAGGQSLATFEHSDAVDSVAFADGHAKLVTGTRDGYSYVWDANVGETRYDLLSPVHALAIAPDGTVAVGTDNSDVTLIRGGTTTKLDDGHIGRVFAVAFTPDGKKLVSAGEDRRPIVWDVATGQKLRELREHKAAVRALAISDDGRWVATAAGDEVNVWTLDGKLVHTLFFDRSATLTTVAFSPQAAYVEAGADDGTLLSWDIQTGQGISWRKLPTAITAIAHSPRDGALVVAAASQVEIFPRVVKDHIQRYGASVSLDSPGEVRSVAFSDDGSLVITAGGDGAKIWDVRTGKLVATRDAHGHALGALALRGSTLWLARSNNDNDNDKDNDNTVASWPVRIETHDAESLDAFVRDRDPWLLGEDDVIQLKGTLDGQRGSDSQ